MEPMCHTALRAARKAAKVILRAIEHLDRLKVEAKGANDFVSEVDRAAEQAIVQHLARAYPDHAILGEEGGASGAEDAEWRWIIDPLDGTANFLRGVPHFAVSIACQHQGKIEHAVVLDPVLREEFTASRGRGAHLNGRRIRVAQRGLEGALLASEIPFKAPQSDQREPHNRSLQTLAKMCAGVRCTGSAALNLAYVAAGRFGGYWEVGLAPWDIAAGALLVREAGGLVADFNGGENFMDSGNIVCGNSKCFKAILQVTKPILGN